jgi:hypothetical protein
LTFQVVDGYFVHFLAPAGLPAVKKNVLFILDISGSMHGRKLAQVKDAMKVILRDLLPGDLFNIFLFDDRIRKWNMENMVPVNDNTLRVAKEYVMNMTSMGGRFVVFPENITSSHSMNAIYRQLWRYFLIYKSPSWYVRCSPITGW